MYQKSVLYGIVIDRIKTIDTEYIERVVPCGRLDVC